MPERSDGLDRIRRPDPSAPRRRDREGKEALYSTSPEAAPTSPVLVRCPRCDVQTGLGLAETAKLFARPFLVNPATRRVWTKCPTCGRRTWLEVKTGQALRAFLDRP